MQWFTTFYVITILDDVRLDVLGKEILQHVDPRNGARSVKHHFIQSYSIDKRLLVSRGETLVQRYLEGCTYWTWHRRRSMWIHVTSPMSIWKGVISIEEKKKNNNIYPLDTVEKEKVFSIRSISCPSNLENSSSEVNIQFTYVFIEERRKRTRRYNQVLSRCKRFPNRHFFYRDCTF